jgi:hypothetical protein
MHEESKRVQVASNGNHACMAIAASFLWIKSMYKAQNHHKRWQILVKCGHACALITWISLVKLDVPDLDKICRRI